MLDEIADAAGKSAGRKRVLLCERILGACTGVLEATYVIKIMTGDLRIGLRAGLVVDAIAAAFGRETIAVRRAASAAGDLGAVALQIVSSRQPGKSRTNDDYSHGQFAPSQRNAVLFITRFPA